MLHQKSVRFVISSLLLLAFAFTALAQGEKEKKSKKENYSRGQPSSGGVAEGVGGVVGTPQRADHWPRLP